jgi:hypothetical protein
LERYRSLPKPQDEQKVQPRTRRYRSSIGPQLLIVLRVQLVLGGFDFFFKKKQQTLGRFPKKPDFSGALMNIPLRENHFF